MTGLITSTVGRHLYLHWTLRKTRFETEGWMPLLAMQRSAKIKMKVRNRNMLRLAV